jgi:hypothetical protein
MIHSSSARACILILDDDNYQTGWIVSRLDPGNPVTGFAVAAIMNKAHARPLAVELRRASRVSSQECNVVEALRAHP